jgi:hypothetical protein
VKKRAQIVADLSKAATFAEQTRLVGELDALDRQAVTAAAAARENDWAEETVRQTLQPVRTHELHTASTEWLDEVDTSGSQYHAKIIAEAAQWYSRVSPEVKADDEEFTIQAHGMVRRQASQYAEAAPLAASAAIDYLSFLRRREGASGLPQIDQTVAPDGVTQQATPIPPDVFDTFGDEIHPINQGVSGTEDSNLAPAIQMNQAGGGQQETLHSEAPIVDEGPAPFTASVAIGHVMNMDQFRIAQAREAAAAVDPRKAVGKTAVEQYDNFNDGTTCGGCSAAEGQHHKPGCAGGTGPHTPYFSGGGMEHGRAARKIAADGDSSQVDDARFPGGVGSTDQDGSAAMDRLVEATGLSAEEVRQRFPNPQEAVKVIDSLDDSKKAASKRVCTNCTNGNHSGTNGTPGCSGGSCACPASGCGKNSGGGTGTGNAEKTGSIQTTAIFHESYGEVSRPQLAAYRKHNISPSDHDDLVRHFGEGSHADITKWVKDQAAENGGLVSTYMLGRDEDGGGFGRFSAKEAASGLDQIQQTTAPDGISQRPTPLPGDVMFPLIDQTEMSSEQLVDPDPRAAVEKAAALDDASSNNCRSCGESLGGGPQVAVDGVRPSESQRTCPNCGVKNYVQRKASLSFTPDDAMSHPEFFKGYGFARRWKTGGRLVRTGTPEFEAGLYAGITDNPENQAGWRAEHAKMAARLPEFSARIAVQDKFTKHVASRTGMRVQGSYVVADLIFEPSGRCMNCSHNIGDHTAGCSHGDCSCPRTYDAANKSFPTKSAKVATTETDLATTSPGTSPSPTGDTPINGPGRPGPLAGYESPAEAGGPAPYQGAPPYGRPVVPGAIAPAQIVPPEVTHSGPPNPFANQQTVAFRRRVQAGLLDLTRED